MSDPIVPEERARDESAAGRAGIYETRAAEGRAEGGAAGNNAVNTYDRPDVAARSGPNVLAIILLLLILALLAYAALQLLH